MTMTEVVAQMDRLALAGYQVPQRLAEMATEWHHALEHVEAERFTAAVDTVLTTKHDRWWPTLGELMALVHQYRPIEPALPSRCATCQGTKWVEATPFRMVGLGEHVYEAVRRCPDCGVPPPDTSYLKRAQRPITNTEWQLRTIARGVPVEMTEEQFVDTLRRMGQHALASRVQRQRGNE